MPAGRSGAADVVPPGTLRPVAGRDYNHENVHFATLGMPSRRQPATPAPSGEVAWRLARRACWGRGDGHGRDVAAAVRAGPSTMPPEMRLVSETPRQWLEWPPAWLDAAELTRAGVMQPEPAAVEARRVGHRQTRRDHPALGHTQDDAALAPGRASRLPRRSC